MAKRDIYIAIMVAAFKGEGVHLSADEVFDLSNDDAIATRAANALDKKDWPLAKRRAMSMGNSPGWQHINPYRKRAAGNLAMTAPEDAVR